MTKEPSKSEEEEVKTDVEETTDSDSASEEQMVPKSRLDKVISQREEALEQLESVKGEIEELKPLKDELAELRARIEKGSSDDTKKFTREEEDALEKIDAGLKQRGYMTKAEYEETRKADRRVLEINRLTDKYKKGSGFPEFKVDEIMIHAKKKGIDDLEAAYRDKHWETLLQKARKGEGFEPVESEKPTGGDRPKQTGISTEEISKMDLNEYEKSGVFDKFKKSIFGK